MIELGKLGEDSAYCDVSGPLIHGRFDGVKILGNRASCEKDRGRDDSTSCDGEAVFAGGSKRWLSTTAAGW